MTKSAAILFATLGVFVCGCYNWSSVEIPAMLLALYLALRNSDLEPAYTPSLGRIR
ncbi:MAG TPA: hypothetical protein VFP26_06180 [Gemmatimonadaceae bacterium]|nr:hypothetical protein [Gemmatimonadaceae bacterium]